MKETTAVKHIRECLDEMYQASNPPITWAECEKNYKEVDNWFWKHTIDEETYITIKKKYLKKLPELYKNTLVWSLCNYGPKIKDKEEEE